MPTKNKPLLIESRNPKVRKRFRDERLALDKTQSAVACDLHLKESYVRMIENSHVDPSFRKMMIFENYFGVPMKELFADRFEAEVPAE